MVRYVREMSQSDVPRRAGAVISDPDGRLLPLLLLTTALVLGMSTWFSATAVVPQLTDAWSLSNTGRAWLTIAVILGFVVGAVFSAALNIADRVRPQLVMLVGGVGAGIANLGLILGWRGRDRRGAPLRNRLLHCRHLPAFVQADLDVVSEGPGYGLGCPGCGDRLR